MIPYQHKIAFSQFCLYNNNRLSDPMSHVTQMLPQEHLNGILSVKEN